MLLLKSHETGLIVYSGERLKVKVFFYVRRMDRIVARKFRRLGWMYFPAGSKEGFECPTRRRVITINPDASHRSTGGASGALASRSVNPSIETVYSLVEEW